MIKFTVVDQGKENDVEYNSSMTCKEFMLDYLRKFSDNVTLDKNRYTFKVGAKDLNHPNILERKLSDVIRPGSRVNLFRKQDIHYSGGSGSYGLDMADISNREGLVEGNYNSSAPAWRIVTKGLNVRGICQNSSCRANGEKVDCQIGFGSFDLVSDCDEVKCPMCKKEIEPITCIFAECQYRMEGKKKENGETKKVNTDWKRVAKDFEYYDPKKSGIVRWLKLTIETKPL